MMINRLSKVNLAGPSVQELALLFQKLLFGDFKFSQRQIFLSEALGPVAPNRSCRPLISVDRKRGQRKAATTKIVKNSQKVSKIFSTLFGDFRAGQKNVKKRQKVSKIFSTLFDDFRAAPVFRPLLGGADNQSRFLGRGCDETLFSEKKRFSVKRGEAIQ